MKLINASVIALACLLFASPACALDPLSLVVLRMLRDQVISLQLEAAIEGGSARGEPLAVRQYPGDLKSIVDQGFPHLDPEQRAAVHERLSALLNDPQHAGQRDLILNEFIDGASASRRAHQALAGLSDAQKRAIAAQAAAAYRGKDPDELRRAIDALRSSAIPMPSDLRQLMLAEFAEQSARALSP